MSIRPALLLGFGALTFALGFITVGYAVELDPAAVTYIKPGDLKWRNPLGVGPNNGVSLWGDGTKPGFYGGITQWNKGGNFSRPHNHPNDRFIYVLKGTWWNGTGTAFDPPNTVPARAGTLVTHLAKGIHWDGAKDEDAMLLIIGDGPATNTPAQQTEGTFDGKLNPQFVTFKTPDQFVWRDPSNAAQTNQTILVGDPSKTGIYMNINRFKPGAFSRPHFHPNDRYIMVLKGTWWVGTGTKFDQNATVPMPAGTFVTHFGKQVHFDGAKDEEVEVLIVGEGPSTTTPAEQK
jgi:quercetin dioxygenase-like cupin family protein